jgi:hypothetical protein
MRFSAHTSASEQNCARANSTQLRMCASSQKQTAAHKDADAHAHASVRTNESALKEHVHAFVHMPAQAAHMRAYSTYIHMHAQ